jgi:hypothetical protein
MKSASQGMRTWLKTGVSQNGADGLQLVQERSEISLICGTRHILQRFRVSGCAGQKKPFGCAPKGFGLPCLF